MACEPIHGLHTGTRPQVPDPWWAVFQTWCSATFPKVVWDVNKSHGKKEGFYGQMKRRNVWVGQSWRNFSAADPLRGFGFVSVPGENATGSLPLFLFYGVCLEILAPGLEYPAQCEIQSPCLGIQEEDPPGWELPPLPKGGGNSNVATGRVRPTKASKRRLGLVVAPSTGQACQSSCQPRGIQGNLPFETALRWIPFLSLSLAAALPCDFQLEKGLVSLGFLLEKVDKNSHGLSLKRTLLLS